MANAAESWWADLLAMSGQVSMANSGSSLVSLDSAVRNSGRRARFISPNSGLMGNEFQRLDIQLKASILFLNIDQIDFLESASLRLETAVSNKKTPRG
jgi:hypothetical protein